jgi:non-heme chloroperoxidase
VGFILDFAGGVLLSIAFSLLIFFVLFCGANPAFSQVSEKGTSIRVTVASSVTLDVVDWGGSGSPMILLSGLGDDAHVFDAFAQKFTPQFHVYGITRRGFGASSAPSPLPDLSNYAPDRLGDDILAVMTKLKLTSSVLVGHSIAGEELSDVGSRFPNRVKALIYLESGYSYAFYDRAHPSLPIALNLAKSELNAITISDQSSRLKPQMLHLAKSTLPALQLALITRAKALGTIVDSPVQSSSPIENAIRDSEVAFGSMHCPVLALYAMPPESERMRQITEDQVRAFENAMPQAKVVRLEKADHYIYVSNEADVIREMTAFLSNNSSE